MDFNVRSGNRFMHPSAEQIQKAAYDRWERRGRAHGRDRDDWIAAETDLIFELNYRRIVQLRLDEPEHRVIGDTRRPRCRFCEQSPPRVAFTHERPIIPEFTGNVSLYTRELCDECDRQFSGSTEAEFLTFWKELEPIRTGETSFREMSVPTGITLGAYKSLVKMALLVMTGDELAHFVDTVEWTSNPDLSFDSSLLKGTGCLVYQTHAPYASPWVSLSRKLDDDAPYPFMLFFLAVSRLVLQIALPLCTRDEDLDGSDVRMLEHSCSTGRGADLEASTCLFIPLRTVEMARPRRFRLFR